MPPVIHHSIDDDDIEELQMTILKNYSGRLREYEQLAKTVVAVETLEARHILQRRQNVPRLNAAHGSIGRM